MKNMVEKIVVFAGMVVLLPLVACSSPDAPQSEAARYAITIKAAANGRASASRETARAGEFITLTVLPDRGYELASINASGGKGIALDGSGSIRTFTMPPENVTVTVSFAPIPVVPPKEGGGAGDPDDTDDPVDPQHPNDPDDTDDPPDPGDASDPDDPDGEEEIEEGEMGPLNIYRGGVREGITIGELSDDKKYYQNSIDMESEMPGRNGHRYSITVSPAVNDNGNAAQQSFGLFSDTEIDLEAVAALSFWAKANKALNIRYVGFGDDDPDKRVVYTGENFNQSIPITTEWKRYIVPVPAPNSGQKTTRVFIFNAQIALGNYVCIDDIEFIQRGVTLTGIEIAGANDTLFYGPTEVTKILRGVPIKLTYAHTDGTTATLQCATNSHTLKYNLLSWLLPFVQVNGTFPPDVIFPPENGNALAVSLRINGIASNPMTAAIIDGMVLDNFEDIEGSGSVTIPGNPVSGTGYLWHTTSTGSVVVGRDYFTVENREIHSGLRAGSWRPGATANNPRGGRNFEAKDAAGYTTLSFWIKVTVGGGNTTIQRDTVFTFELRNGGLLTSKTNGAMVGRQFTYDPADTDGWQEIQIPLAELVEGGLDASAITGYAFGVVDNKGVSLRIMLDDIALVK